MTQYKRKGIHFNIRSYLKMANKSGSGPKFNAFKGGKNIFASFFIPLSFSNCS